MGHVNRLYGCIYIRMESDLRTVTTWIVSTQVAGWRYFHAEGYSGGGGYDEFICKAPVHKHEKDNIVCLASKWGVLNYGEFWEYQYDTYGSTAHDSTVSVTDSDLTAIDFLHQLCSKYVLYPEDECSAYMVLTEHAQKMVKSYEYISGNLDFGFLCWFSKTPTWGLSLRFNSTNGDIDEQSIS